jgi:hypothetical protein
MTLITQSRQPAFAAVFYAEDSRIEQAAAEAKRYIHEVDTVVVLRNQSRLDQSWRIASQNRSIRVVNTNVVVGNDKLFVKAGGKFEPTNVKGVEVEFGYDFGVFARFNAALGPTAIQVRSVDDNAQELHIDDGFTFEEVPSLKKTLGRPSKTWNAMPFGTTSTLSVHALGTRLIDAPRSEFKTVVDEGRFVWEWEMTPCRKPEEWDAPPGSIVLMRTRDWHSDPTPRPHSSQPRLHDGDPQERIVGVGHIVSLNL